MSEKVKAKILVFNYHHELSQDSRLALYIFRIDKFVNFFNKAIKFLFLIKNHLIIFSCFRYQKNNNIFKLYEDFVNS